MGCGGAEAAVVEDAVGGLDAGFFIHLQAIVLRAHGRVGEDRR